MSNIIVKKNLSADLLQLQCGFAVFLATFRADFCRLCPPTDRIITNGSVSTDVPAFSHPPVITEQTETLGPQLPGVVLVTVIRKRQSYKELSLRMKCNSMFKNKLEIPVYLNSLTYVSVKKTSQSLERKNLGSNIHCSKVQLVFSENKLSLQKKREKNISL